MHSNIAKYSSGVFSFSRGRYLDRHTTAQCFFSQDVQYLSIYRCMAAEWSGYFRQQHRGNGSRASRAPGGRRLRPRASAFRWQTARDPEINYQLRGRWWSALLVLGGFQSQQSNYAQLIFEIYDKDDMPKLVGPLQTALSDSVPGAYLDVRQLQTNPVQYPIEIHVFGQADVEPAQEEADIDMLRSIAGQIAEVLRSTPEARRVRTDWMQQIPIVQLPINSDRANLAGVTNADIAQSAAGGLAVAGRNSSRRRFAHTHRCPPPAGKTRATGGCSQPLRLFLDKNRPRSAQFTGADDFPDEPGKNRPPRPLPNDDRNCFSRAGYVAVGSYEVGHTENRSASSRASTELSHRDWWRTVQTRRRLQRIGGRAGYRWL